MYARLYYERRGYKKSDTRYSNPLRTVILLLHEPSAQQNYQRTLSVKTLCYYINSAFIDIQSRKSFLLECVRHFIPDATDANGLYNLNQLEDVKEQVLRLHHKMYSVNKENLHDIGINSKLPSDRK